MEKFEAIWEDCGYNDISIQQRCEAVKKHVEVSTVLRLRLELSIVVFYFSDLFVFMIHREGKKILS
jgi:hypothetical protein